MLAKSTLPLAVLCLAIALEDARAGGPGQGLAPTATGPLSSAPFAVKKHCTTAPTGPDGARETCSVDVCHATQGKAFIIEGSVTVTEVDGRGSEHSCSAPFITEEREIQVTLPDGPIKVWVPVEMCTRASARSDDTPGAQGRSECELAGKQIHF